MRFHPMPRVPAPSVFRDFGCVDLKKPNGEVIKGQRDVGFNIVKYFPITDSEAVPGAKR